MRRSRNNRRDRSVRRNTRRNRSIKRNTRRNRSVEKNSRRNQRRVNRRSSRRRVSRRSNRKKINKKNRTNRTNRRMRGGGILDRLRRKQKVVPIIDPGESTGFLQGSDDMPEPSPSPRAATPKQSPRLLQRSNVTPALAALPGFLQDSIPEPTPEPDDEVNKQGRRIYKENAMILMRGMNLRRSIKWAKEHLEWAKDYLNNLRFLYDLDEYRNNPISDEQQGALNEAMDDIGSREMDLKELEQQYEELMAQLDEDE